MGSGIGCVCCGSAAVAERPEHTARGYHRFRCRDCGRQFNQRSGGLLNRARYPSDVVALVVSIGQRALLLRFAGALVLVEGDTRPAAARRRAARRSRRS